MGYSFRRWKDTTVTTAFQKIFRKPNKIWIGGGNEFYKRSMKSFLQNNDIQMYSMHNEGKSFIDERFVRTLKNKIYKYMTLV